MHRIHDGMQIHQENDAVEGISGISKMDDLYDCGLSHECEMKYLCLGKSRRVHEVDHSLQMDDMDNCGLSSECEMKYLCLGKSRRAHDVDHSLRMNNLEYLHLAIGSHKNVLSLHKIQCRLDAARIWMMNGQGIRCPRLENEMKCFCIDWSPFFRGR